MLHEPAAQTGEDHAAEFKSRLGVILFIVYALFYGGFVAINVIKPVLMETTIAFGLNLACVYGFALIVVALIMALVYNAICNRKEAQMDSAATEEEGV